MKPLEHVSTSRPDKGTVERAGPDRVQRAEQRLSKQRLSKQRAESRQAAPEHRNEVLLVGRVAAPAEERELPSGDVIAVWRLVVDRPPLRRAPPAGQRPATVDTVDCVAWTASVKRAVTKLDAGDVVSISGALRRRFWRAGSATASRYEIEVARVQRLPSPTARDNRPTQRKTTAPSTTLPRPTGGPQVNGPRAPG